MKLVLMNLVGGAESCFARGVAEITLIPGPGVTLELSGPPYLDRLLKNKRFYQRDAYSGAGMETAEIDINDDELIDCVNNSTEVVVNDERSKEWLAQIFPEVLASKAVFNRRRIGKYF